ncbi:unnamed protein product [Chrysoparadoxa australica]
MVAAKKEVGEKQACGEMMQDAEPVGAPHPPAPIPVGAYKGVEKFGWDQGEYNSAWVTIYVTLEGAGRAKDSTTCNFSKRGFDLKVEDLEGQKYRLVKDNLDKDIVPEDCKFIVKKDRIVIKLKKVKGEYSYDHWTDLTQKRPKAAASKGKKDDPMGGIMDMMKDMYDQGDDNMKKTIGESMRKVCLSNLSNYHYQTETSAIGLTTSTLSTSLVFILLSSSSWQLLHRHLRTSSRELPLLHQTTAALMTFQVVWVLGWRTCDVLVTS